MTKPTVSVPHYFNAIIVAGMALAAGAVFLMSQAADTPAEPVKAATHAHAPVSTLQPSLVKADMPANQHNDQKLGSFEQFNRRMKPVMDTIDEWTPPAVFKKLF